MDLPFPSDLLLGPPLSVQLRPQLLWGACVCMCVCLSAPLAGLLQTHSLHLVTPVMPSSKQHLEVTQTPSLVNCDSRSLWAL